MFVSRAGQKLDHALTTFALDVAGFVCADLGCNVGGFTDCLLRRGASRVYAVDTGYGVLDYRLRKDPRVVVMERTNALHLHLPQPVQLVCIDVAWTRQHHILPAARQLLPPFEQGQIISLIKPHYEADARLLRGGVLTADEAENVLQRVRAQVMAAGFQWLNSTPSPIRGAKGNVEYLAYLRPHHQPDSAANSPAA
ncbi:MAG: hypothetical protein IT448_01770 [Phycisphaerales bacterium]|nr:hypothetical protein [Phycisphaerales bacterium]